MVLSTTARGERLYAEREIQEGFEHELCSQRICQS
jgi:hypothetical protein